MRRGRDEVVDFRVNSVSYEQALIVWPAQLPTIEVADERGFGAEHWLAAAAAAVARLR